MMMTDLPPEAWKVARRLACITFNQLVHVSATLDILFERLGSCPTATF